MNSVGNVLPIVSILTRPEGRVQQAPRQPLPLHRIGFNPHPSRRTGATSKRLQVALENGRFQSSPVPKDGCNWGAKKPTCTRSLFQSSPVPKDGCNTIMFRTLVSVVGFNPHPSRRTGATVGAAPLFVYADGVSILTRPEGRVQHLQRWWGAVGEKVGFNPHPSRRTGATDYFAKRVILRGVSILTRPEGRVQLEIRWENFCEMGVSILTRPEGRVQRDAQENTASRGGCFNPHPSRRTGATHSRCRQRRQHKWFQSSPVPKDGCNCMTVGTDPCRWFGFQSSPVPKDGCNPEEWLIQELEMYVSILTRPEGRVQLPPKAFQSCPETNLQWSGSSASRFQSSPVPKDGCNLSAQPKTEHHKGPEGRVQPMRMTSTVGLRLVSILTRPEGRVQHTMGVSTHPWHSFNPHPSRRTGATHRAVPSREQRASFNPHPSRRTGATSQVYHGYCLPDEGVSILTRPEGRVQLARGIVVAYQHVLSFNPHPSRRTGATCDGEHHQPHDSLRVSILTRPEGRVQRRTTALNSTLWSNFSVLSPC
jgi:hypothetical protein